ncbi:YbaN family protein [Ostreiculturibacter nitratireducens]|uniref:YbaN family protein n=1 Tax=Ostreiculturibacter nitratireducens TaxID=3075226 RepID=UPI0031B63CD3
MKIFWLILGVISVVLGIIGVFLPIMPTVPFLLLATYSFARSSERLHHWILTHPTYGPPIIAWNERGAISKRSKRLATLSILAGYGLSLLLGFPTIVLIIQAMAFAAVILFILTRPSV